LVFFEVFNGVLDFFLELNILRVGLQSIFFDVHESGDLVLLDFSLFWHECVVEMLEKFERVALEDTVELFEVLFVDEVGDEVLLIWVLERVDYLFSHFAGHIASGIRNQLPCFLLYLFFWHCVFTINSCLFSV